MDNYHRIDGIRDTNCQHSTSFLIVSSPHHFPTFFERAREIIRPAGLWAKWADREGYVRFGRQALYRVRKPPSTAITWPIVKLAPGPQSHTTAEAISSGRPKSSKPFCAS
jgi:hypothetical protein